jgi:hypothetical protein
MPALPRPVVALPREAHAPRVYETAHSAPEPPPCAVL